LYKRLKRRSVQVDVIHMAFGPSQRGFNLLKPTEEIPKQVRFHRAKDRAKALGLRLKPVKGSQLFLITPTKRAVVPVAYDPMTLGDVEAELTHLAQENTGGG
jgi:hypothetical protein